jgi:hypothetical protein
LALGESRVSSELNHNKDKATPEDFLAGSIDRDDLGNRTTTLRYDDNLAGALNTVEDCKTFGLETTSSSFTT